MFPIEVTWQPESNNSTNQRGIWVDTVTIRDEQFGNAPYRHKAVIVDFGRNTVNLISLDKVRTLESFVGDENTEVAGPSPRPINLYGRRIITGREDSQP